MYFSLNPQNISFSSSIPSYLLKVTKFLGKISPPPAERGRVHTMSVDSQDQLVVFSNCLRFEKNKSWLKHYHRSLVCTKSGHFFIKKKSLQKTSVACSLHNLEAVNTPHLSRISHLSEVPAKRRISLSKNKSFIWEWIHPTEVGSHLNAREISLVFLSLPRCST